jgi:hypothetical protein
MGTAQMQSKPLFEFGIRPILLSGSEILNRQSMYVYSHIVVRSHAV